MNALIYGNGGSGNHGCEAIVRGTSSLLGSISAIHSINPDEDQKYGLHRLTDIIEIKENPRHNLPFLKAYLKLKLTGNYTDMDGLAYHSAIHSWKKKCKIALSAGGDNYCYEGTAKHYAHLNKLYRNAGMSTVLWGCSIEPDVVQQPSVAKDLRSYNMIIARESITYEALKPIQPNLHLMPDPAFYMEAAPCSIDPRLEKGTVIGINASPHILTCESSAGIAYENYRQLISHILRETDATIALIPHVVWESNDDRKVLRQLYDDFDQNERLVLVEDHSAPELKYIISKCSFFVGARTHATIAAYSSCVPTLVVGYSVKARGIARDLFGTEEGYVLPVQNLKSPEQLSTAFSRLYTRSAECKTHLCAFLPEYLAANKKAIEFLKEVL